MISHTFNAACKSFGMESNPEKSYTISLNSFEDDNIRNIREEQDSTVSGLSYKYIDIFVCSGDSILKYIDTLTYSYYSIFNRIKTRKKIFVH